MVTYRRHGAGWQAQIIRKGFPARYRTFDTKDAAKKWAVQIEAEMSKGTYSAPSLANSTTFEDALDRYKREVSARKKGARQEASRVGTWKKSELATRPLGLLETADFSAHVEQRRKAGKAENTIRLEIALASHLFKKARTEWGMKSLANPLDDLEWPKGSNERSRRLSEKEIRAIIAAYPSREFGIMLELACETAMRRSEICGLDWSNVDLDPRVAHLPETKNKDARDVPRSKRAVELLASRPSRKGAVFSLDRTASRRHSVVDASGRGMAFPSASCGFRRSSRVGGVNRP